MESVIQINIQAKFSAKWEYLCTCTAVAFVEIFIYFSILYLFYTIYIPKIFHILKVSHTAAKMHTDHGGQKRL